MEASYELYEKLRDKKGVTDYRVAKDTHISTATISEWKNGKYTLKFDKLWKIAKYLDVNVEDLVK